MLSTALSSFFRVFSILLVKRRPRFHDQAVCRNVFRLQICHCPQSPLPTSERLPRDCRDQVYIHIFKSCPAHDLPRSEEFLISMDTPEHFKFIVIYGLQPDTEAVYAIFLPCRGLLLCHGSGVHFHGDLSVFCNIKTVQKCPEDIPDVIRLQYGRSTAAQKYRTHLIRFIITFPAPDLSGQGFYIKRPLLRISRGGQEITVRTFLHTERNMHVQF